MVQQLAHKHYVGQAHSFEILNQDPIRPDVTILKTFFIDDTVNENDWHQTPPAEAIDRSKMIKPPDIEGGPG